MQHGYRQSGKVEKDKLRLYKQHGLDESMSELALRSKKVVSPEDYLTFKAEGDSDDPISYREHLLTGKNERAFKTGRKSHLCFQWIELIRFF